MKTLALWCIALVLAVGILWRIARRKKVVLTGRWTPRLVQMVITIVVAFSPLASDEVAFADDPPAAKDKPAADAAVPLPLDAHTLKRWREQWSHDESMLVRFKRSFLPIEAGTGTPSGAALKEARNITGALPDRLRQIVLGDIEARASGKTLTPVPPKALREALAAMRRDGCFDAWLLGYLWRITGRRVDPAARAGDVALYAELRQFARLLDTLVLSRGRVKASAFNPRAWMSKAGPSKTERRREERLRRLLLAEAAKLWPTSVAESWARDAHIEFGLARDSSPVVLHRAGAKHSLKAKEALVRFARLDLLETPASGPPVVLSHVWLGALPLPRGRTLSVWDLPGLLPASVVERLRTALDKALLGDALAAQRIESTLPVSHAELRRALDKQPKAAGAPRLRTILSLFDERTVPPPK